MKRYIPYILITLGLLGLWDASYLTIEHYRDVIPPCSIHDIFADCGRVLRSEYSVVFGVPLALFGVLQYSLVTAFSFSILLKHRVGRHLLLIQTTGGFLFSLYFVYLQLGVIHSICLYCMASAFISSVLFVLVQVSYSRERKELCIYGVGFLYKTILKKIFFLFDAELVHESIVRVGEFVGGSVIVQPLVRYAFVTRQPTLEQKIAGIEFTHPIGLAAGFDYEARLTQTLAPWGFGFQTIGTITNQSYAGNPRPMLGRLPESKSLLVNKGFKNLGAEATIEKLQDLRFRIPVGVSIGRTNSKELQTQKQSIEDILLSFMQFEQSTIPFAYYELNISCPNLFGDITFYPKANLKELLVEVDKLDIQRPIFVKMPIERTDTEVVQMLDVISAHSPKGVIFGNLQKDRNHPSLIPHEVARMGKGNFSGKPTFDRSNDLISLAYKAYRERFIIIGCGGIFSASDAYRKIKRGASLLQLITGMIFEGPQLVAEINLELEEILKKKGFSHIKEAIGSRP